MMKKIKKIKKYEMLGKKNMLMNVNKTCMIVIDES
jgi:hypothetical protein